MALLNLSYVTQSLTALIKAAVEASDAWPTGSPVTVSPRPPDALKGSENTLGFYLYHVSEDGCFKNLAPDGNDFPPGRYTPIGLNLFYQLTAHGDDSDVGTHQAQLMMGLAVKALRDYAIIKESTEVVSRKMGQKQVTKILDSNLKGTDTQLRITLQPLPANEAVSYWTAGPSALRLASYYQVYVVLLEPEPSRSRAGRVLTYGTHAFVGGMPRLESSRNVLLVTMPGGETNEIELKPAQAPPAIPALGLPPPAPQDPDPIASRVIFAGVNLRGETTVLFLRNARWEQPIEVTDTSWKVTSTVDRITTLLRENLGATVMLPGIYSAFIKVKKTESFADGSSREFEYTSNEMPFVVSPRIDGITKPDGDKIVTVTGFIFEHSIKGQDSIAKSLQVYLANVRLRSGTAGYLQQGEFAIEDATTLKLRLPEELPPTTITPSGKAYLPLRLFVNGAESPPNWVEVS